MTIDNRTIPEAFRAARCSTGGLAGGFLLAFHLPLRAAVNEPVQPPDATDGKFAPNAFIRIDDDRPDHAGDAAGRDGTGHLHLDCDDPGRRARRRLVAGRRCEHAPPNDKLYGNPIVRHPGHRQFQFGPGVLEAAAQGRRERARDAGAGRGGSNGRSIRRAARPRTARSCTRTSGRKLSYGALALAASSQTPPKDVPLKDPKDFVLIGKPLKRLDTPDKVNGKAVYGIDAMLPGMKFATLAQCPVFGGKVGKVDDSAAKKIPGVRQIVVLDDLVAVVGDHMWAAKKGLEALDDRLGRRPERAHQLRTTSGGDLRAASEKDGAVAKSDRRHRQGPRDRRPKFEAAYELPFLAHATMEPMNATVHVKPDSCEIWTGTQVMTRVQSEAAKAAGLPVEKVIVNNHLLGGGFGRKLEPDMVGRRRCASPSRSTGRSRWCGPARRTSSTTSIVRSIATRSRRALSDGKIVGWKYQVTRLVDHGALAAAGVPEGHRHRRRR